MKIVRINFFTVISLGFIGFATITSCEEEKKIIKPVVIEFKKEGELTLKKANDSIITSINIEIADDEYQTQTGLMYRDDMKDNQGMLFIFQEADYHSFYMKNTRIALDIIYIDADKSIVSIQKNAKPLDETSIPSKLPAQYVLEINAGLTDKWKINVGDKIDFKRN